MKTVKIYTISDIKYFIECCDNEINKYERFLERDKDYLEYLKNNDNNDINNRLVDIRLIKDHESDITEYQDKLENLYILYNYLVSILSSVSDSTKWFMYDKELHVLLSIEIERLKDDLL